MFLKPPGPEGVVYLLWSQKLDLHKIGVTQREARVRARELNEELGADFEVVAFIETEEPRKLESLFHKSFSDERVSPKREWFRLTPEQEELFIRLAEDQRWIRENSDTAERFEEYKTPPDASPLREQGEVREARELFERAQELLQPELISYDGIWFRSQTEARWAVFFNALKIPYKYMELKEGYVLDSALGTYLPDFWLPEQDCWVEIKGEEPSEKEKERLEALVLGTKKDGYIFYGDICPPTGSYGQSDLSAIALPFEDDEYSGEHVGEDFPYWWCECHKCGALGIQFEGRGARIPCGCSHGGAGDVCTHDDKCRAFDTPRLLRAYMVARSASFEFGEKG